VPTLEAFDANGVAVGVLQQYQVISMSHRLLGSLLLALTLPLIGQAAPVPLPRAPQIKPLTQASLVGTWAMDWGGCQCTVTFSASGEYKCSWGGTQFIGTWCLDPKGTLWICESYAPDCANSWRTFSVRFAPGSLKGKVEFGSNSWQVRLDRKR